MIASELNEAIHSSDNFEAFPNVFVILDMQLSVHPTALSYGTDFNPHHESMSKALFNIPMPNLISHMTLMYVDIGVSFFH